MKAVICLCALVIVALARAEEKYTTKYDDTNVQEVLDNPRLVQSYVDCGLETGKCTAEGNELKSHIKDALETKCAKCSEKQKEKIRTVIRFLIKNKPDDWSKLVAKYDPEGKYAKMYEEEYKSVSSK